MRPHFDDVQHDDDSGWATCLNAEQSTLTKTHPASSVHVPHHSKVDSAFIVANPSLSVNATHVPPRSHKRLRHSAGIPQQQHHHAANASGDIVGVTVASSSPAADAHGDGTSIFLSVVPNHLQSEEALRAMFPSSFVISSIKIVQSANRTRAWISLPTATVCLDALRFLQMNSPHLGARIHVPQRTTVVGDFGSNKKDKQSLQKIQHHKQPQHQYRHQNFEQKLSQVLRNGGVGNTLLFVNVPPDVTHEEMESHLSVSSQDVQNDTFVVMKKVGSVGNHVQNPLPPPPLRVRFATNKSGHTLNFWAVYASVSDCIQAHEVLSGLRITLRSGRIFTLRPCLHDDSTDADETRRRQRTLQLGVQPSRPSLSEKMVSPASNSNNTTEDTSGAPKATSVRSSAKQGEKPLQALEKYLRLTFAGQLVFLHDA